jgi:acetyl-CoA decarbonylase/synthase complex subunit gamma
MIKDTEGLSVMTAWAAGKFSADSIARFVNSSGIANKVSHRRIIIPGYLSCETCSLEEELAGWTIETGPREAAQLPVYLRDWNNKGG